MNKGVIELTATQLNRAAVKLAGWQYKRSGHIGWHLGTYAPYGQRTRHNPPHRYRSNIPKYTTDICQAMELVAEMSVAHRSVVLRTMDFEDGGGYYVCEMEGDIEVEAPTLPLAIASVYHYFKTGICPILPESP